MQSRKRSIRSFSEYLDVESSLLLVETNADDESATVVIDVQIKMSARSEVQSPTPGVPLCRCIHPRTRNRIGSFVGSVESFNFSRKVSNGLEV